MHYGVHPSKADGQKYFLPWMGGAFEDGWSVNPHWVAGPLRESAATIRERIERALHA